MATGQRNIRSILNPTQQSKRTSITLKNDKHMLHGKLLLAAQQSTVPLERLLAVGQLAVTFLTDLLRHSDDTQDIPIMILGHHYLSHRQLGEGAGAGAMPGIVPPPTGPAPAPTAAAAAAGSSGTTYAAYLQEICTFDGREGPKSFVGAEGIPLALLALQLAPRAVAKSKKLGRELSIRVDLGSAAAAGAAASVSSGSSLQLLSWGEEYVISWPSMRLMEPTSARCPVAFKGDMIISCPTTGLFMSLSFAKDNSVKGTIEQLAPKPTAAAAAAAAAPRTAVAAISAEVMQSGKPQLVGSVSGYWTSNINVSCPTLGLEGVLYSGASITPSPIPYLDLTHLGPMRLPRVWSAIHDALLYMDPKIASGGRSAAKLSLTMSQYLKALTLDNASSRDVTSGVSGLPGAAAAAAGSSSQGLSFLAGRAGASSAGALSSSALSTAGSDADLEEFDRMTEGKSRDMEDRRDVPPCYKAQHASGNKLRYLLHYTLTSLPSSTTSTAA